MILKISYTILYRDDDNDKNGKDDIKYHLNISFNKKIRYMKPYVRIAF